MKRIDTVAKAAFIAILLLAVGLFLFAVVHENTAQGDAYIGSFAVSELSDGWTLTTADGKTVENVRLPMAARQEKGAAVVLRNRLPEDIRDGMRLCIRSQRQIVTIRVNGEARSSYRAATETGVKRSPESAFVLADLYDEDASGEIAIEIIPGVTEAGIYHTVTYAYGNNVWFPYIRANLPLVIISAILILASLLTIAAYFIMRRKMSSIKIVLYLAEAMLVAGFWMLSESEIRQIIFRSPAYSSVFSFLLIELLAPALLMYINELQGHHYERAYVTLETIAIGQIVLNSVLNFSGAASYYETLIYSHIWSLLGILLAVGTIAADVRTKRIKKYPMTAAGMVVLLFFGTLEIANFYSSSNIGFGFFLGVGLIALLGATAMQTASNEWQRMEQKRLADNANRAKSFFLANMSHEIRTPINAILGMDEMILRESGEEQIVSYAGDIQSAGKTLLSLINDILDFSKIEEGRMEILPTQYDLASVINDLVSMIGSRAETKGLRFAVHVDENTPQLLYGDEIRIRQCALNLLTNAVKYTESGTVTLNVGFDKLDGERIALKVSVSDTGIGMRQEDMDKLFLPFSRIEEDRNRAIEGTGLGMSITQQLLMLMGSSLDVQSTYGKGSTFSFAIEQPVVKWTPVGDLAGRHAASAARRAYRERLHAPDAHILVIDDTPLNLSVVKGLLKKTRIQIDTAESGPEAIEKAARQRYDIIFVDHMMPGMDGIETLRELKKLPDAERIVYIALTANALSGSRERYLEAGFSDYLSKPVEGEKLEEMLLTYLPEEKLLKEPAEPASPPILSDKPRVLVVDDDELIRHLANEILDKSFLVDSCSNGADALRKAQLLRPDLILLDIDLEHMTGFEVLRALRERPETSDIPVVFLTGSRDEDSEIACFRSGAADFVRKPFIPEVLLQRTRRIAALDRLQRNLQSEVRRQTVRAECLTKEMMLALSKAVDAKDHYTNGHSERVAAYSAEIARRMGKSPQEQEKIYETGLMHDIGKIGVSEEIINKTSRLTDEEFEKIKRHTVIGSDILRLITQMPELADGARSHHERYDGTGYPDGRKGTEIPEAARIICLADCYDAMTSTRTYSTPHEQQAVRREIERCSGTQFDPEIAKILLAMIDEDKDYLMTERTADIRVWKGSDRLWTLSEQPLPPSLDEARAGEEDESDVELPDWLYAVDEIDTARGLRYCGTKPAYLETLTIYAKNASAVSDEIEGLWRANDVENTAVKVHALKSMSRAIGAEELGALAEKLELAGKAGDTQTLSEELDGLLTRLRALGKALAPLRATEQAEGDGLPLISDEELRDAYDGIRELAESFDSDSAAYILNRLDGYRIPDGERERVERLRHAIENFDWDQLDTILS